MPYLHEREAEEYVFSPEAERRLRYAQMRTARKTSVQPSQTNRKKAEPKRQPGKKYLVSSYRTAIQRATAKYNRLETIKAEEEGRKPNLIKRWFPNQLRKTKGTESRAVGGLETAQGVLGHANAKTTEIYAEIDARRTIAHAKKYG